MCVGGTHPNPSHTWGQGSLESFQPRRSCPGRNTEVSPLMCAGKTRLASSQRQGSQSLASAAALPSKAASPTGPQHVEPELLLPRRVISTGLSPQRRASCSLVAHRTAAAHRARGSGTCRGCIFPCWLEVSAAGLGGRGQHQELHHRNRSWGGWERAARRGRALLTFQSCFCS